MRFLFVALLLILTSISNGQTGNVKGNVSDGNSPIPLVNVIIINTGLGAGTESNGDYEIRGIPVGEYTIRFSAVGWETKTADISITENRTLELNVKLVEKSIEFGEVGLELNLNWTVKNKFCPLVLTLLSKDSLWSQMP